MPLVHATGQLTGAPHWPFAPHVWTALLEHCVAPETHVAPPSVDASIVASCEASAVLVSVASAAVPSSTVASPGPVSAVSSPPPLLLPFPLPLLLPLLLPLVLPLLPTSAVASDALPMLLPVLPPQDAASIPASAPAKANRIEDREAIMGPRRRTRIAEGEFEGAEYPRRGNQRATAAAGRPLPKMAMAVALRDRTRAPASHDSSRHFESCASCRSSIARWRRGSPLGAHSRRHRRRWAKGLDEPTPAGQSRPPP